MGSNAMGYAGTGLSAYSAYNSSKKSNSPENRTTQSWLTPSSELGGWDSLRGYQDSFDKYADFSFVEDLWNRYTKMAAAGAGGGLGGGAWKGASKWIGNFLPKEDEYTTRVRDEGYLDIADDPYYQARLQASQKEFTEELRKSLGSAFSSFAGGGSMGMSGAHGMFRQRLSDDALENWANQLAEMDSSEVAQRRAEAMSANQAYQGVRANWQNAAAGNFGASQARAASGYASGLQGMLAAIMAPSAISTNYLNAGSRFHQDWATKNMSSPETGGGKSGNILSGLSSGLGTYNSWGGGGKGGGQNSATWNDMYPNSSPTGYA